MAQRRLVGVATADFALYADVVATLKRVRIRFVSFDPTEKPPGNVGVVVCSTEDRPTAAREPSKPGSEIRDKIGGRRYVVLDWAQLDEQGRRQTLALLPFRVLWALADYPLLKVGVDPGPRPGLALLCSKGLLAEYQAPDEATALDYLTGLLELAGPGMVLVRVGHGAPLPRNRLVAGLFYEAEKLWGPAMEEQAPPLAIEVVDEWGSSSGTRASSNLAAAAHIAGQPGYRLRRPLRSYIKASDVAKVQEASRRKTEGRYTLSALAAEVVAAGQMSLEEALKMERR